MSIKRWVVPPLDKEAAAQLSEDCEINPFLALLLVTRGITDAESTADFLLGNDVSDDPYSFADMDLAVDRIQRAIDNYETIAVYGDYDVDGITATVLLYSYLREKGANAIYYIPNREREGYGLHNDSIEYLSKQGANLIVTVDNGVSAVEEIKYASEKGIDVVITDHHQLPLELPPAVAVVDPHRQDCGSEFKDYAGVGVVFKLVCAMDGDTDLVLEKYGDLVALGTLADVMPLRGENRALVRVGINILNENPRPGIKALQKAAGINKRYLNSISVVFGLVPRLNAAGRMDSADIAVRLLLTKQNVVADTLASQVQEFNLQRQSVEADILNEIIDRLQREPELLADRVLIIDGKDWHPGVIGIIASRIVDRYGKPCILITTKDGESKGSGRSVSGFSLYEAVSSCSGILSRFGGHELAAGISLPYENIKKFRKMINEFAENHYPEMPFPQLQIDFKLKPSQVDVEKLNLISALEPLGAGNPQPVFGLFGMRLDNIMPMGKGKHLRLSVSRDNVRLSVCAFNKTYANFPYECGQTINLVVTLERNEYRGVVTPSLFLKDMRIADLQQDELLMSFRNFDSVIRKDKVSSENADKWMPERKQVERIYRFLRGKKKWTGTLEQLCFLLGKPAISYIRIRLVLEILRQAELLAIKDNGNNLEITLLPAAKKVNLNLTPVLQHLNSCLVK